MGNIMLTVDEYNKLHGADVRGYMDEDDRPRYFCKEADEKIYIIQQNEDGEDVIAKFDANTPDGELFYRLRECMIQIIPDEDDGRSLSINRCCFWCDKEIGCRIFNKVSYKELEKVKFVDPVQFRCEDLFLILERWKNNIEGMKENPIQSEFCKIKEINETVQKLYLQLSDLFNEWKYE